MVETGSTAIIGQVWPLLFVRDLTASVEFYRGNLGFELVGRAEDDAGTMYWCRLERGGASIMLQQSEDPGRARGEDSSAVGLYIQCDDAEAVYAELSGRGMPVEPPTVAYYGMKQLFTPDPDGHAICFESPTVAWEE